MRAKINLALLILLAACIGALVTMRAWEGRSRETARLIPRGRGERLYSPAPERFRSGESLSYRVSWSTFATAATASISIPERLYFFGDNVWNLRAQVSTVNPVRRLFTIDDQFTSYSDVNTLQSRQYVMKLDELGRKRVQQFRSSLTGPGNTGSFGAIPAGAFDPLGGLFLLRTVDWQQPVAAEIFDGKQIYEMIAQRTGEEAVISAGGKIPRVADSRGLAARERRDIARCLSIDDHLAGDGRFPHAGGHSGCVDFRHSEAGVDVVTGSQQRMIFSR